MVSSHSRPDFSDRVRFALGPDRRTHRREWNYSSAGISSSRPRSTWRPRIIDLANAVLVQFKRRVAACSLWRRSRFVAASDFRNRARAVIGRARGGLFVARDRRANVPQFSVGHSPARDRLLVHLSRAMAALAETRN